MAEMIQVGNMPPPRPTTDIIGKHSHGEQQAAQASDKIFDLADTERVLRSREKPEQLGEENVVDKQHQGKVGSHISRNPAMGAAIFKAFAGSAALNALMGSGKPELLNKVAEFSNEVLLTPDKLLSDIMKQESEITVFKGGLFEELRNALAQLMGQGGAGGTQGSLGASAFLDAITDFMKAFNAANSKDDILNSIAAGLKYLAEEAAPSKELADALNAAANDLNKDTFASLKSTILNLLNVTEKSLILNDQTKNLIPLIIYNMSRFSNKETAVNESFNALLNMSDPETAAKLKAAFITFIENSDLSAQDKLSALKQSDSATAQRSMTMLTDRLASSVKDTIQNFTSEKISAMIGNIDATKGSEALRELLNPFLSPNMGGALNTLLRNFESTKDLNTLIDRLGIIVNNVDNMDSKIVLAQKMNEILSFLSQSANVNYKPPTSLENMLEFLSKNIDDPVLKSMSSISKGDMVNGLVTAPSVQTPLLHFLIPLNISGFKAFGELWADPSAENRKKGGDNERCRHMFLCFDVENTGYFELEVFTYDTDMNVLLLCPEGTQDRFAALKDSLPLIAESGGYKISNAAIGPLNKRRDLAQVFPKVRDNRVGLNVSA